MSDHSDNWVRGGLEDAQEKPQLMNTAILGHQKYANKIPHFICTSSHILLNAILGKYSRIAITRTSLGSYNNSFVY